MDVEAGHWGGAGGEFGEGRDWGGGRDEGWEGAFVGVHCGGQACEAAVVDVCGAPVVVIDLDFFS